MRPWPTLGYDRDRIALHLIAKEAFPQAETELRRAIWLNPYEWRFKFHLALCLLRIKHFVEAREWARRALEQQPGARECQEMLVEIEAALQAAGQAEPHDNQTT